MQREVLYFILVQKALVALEKLKSKIQVQNYYEPTRWENNIFQIKL